MTALSTALETRDKATPGPWSADYSTVFAGDEELADFWHNALSTDQTRANAIITAAAPDALDWIAKALPYIQHERAETQQIVNMRLHDKRFERQLAELTALIAQAEGKEVGE